MHNKIYKIIYWLYIIHYHFLSIKKALKINENFNFFGGKLNLLILDFKSYNLQVYIKLDF